MGHDITVLTKKYHDGKAEAEAAYTIEYLWSLPKAFLEKTTLFLSILFKVAFRKYDLAIAVNLYPTGYCAALVKSFINYPLIVHAIGVDIEMDEKIGYGYRLNPKIEKRIKASMKYSDGVLVCS